MWSRLGIWERNAAGFRFADGWNVRRVQGQVWGKRDIGASMAWREQARGCAEEMFGERGGMVGAASATAVFSERGAE